jgi:hypothetical protein
MIKKTLVIALTAAAAVSCHSHVVLVPPAMDLGAYEPIGIIMFTAENAKGDLEEMSTQIFLKQLTQYQKAPVIEMGSLEAVLRKAGVDALGPETDSLVGEAFGVKSFFVGTVTISKVKPQVDIGAVLNQRLRVRTSTDITATVRLLSAESGATLWTDSSTLNGTLGVLSAGQGETPYVGVRDQDQAARDFLNELFYELTWDFRPTRRRL